MKILMIPLLASALVLGGCDQEEGASSQLTVKVAGTVAAATIHLDTPEGIQVLESQPLPFVHDFSGTIGEAVHVYASAPSATATLYIQLLEEDRPVQSDQGCLCNGDHVSATLSAVIGNWE